MDILPAIFKIFEAHLNGFTALINAFSPDERLPFLQSKTKLRSFVKAGV